METALKIERAQDRQREDRAQGQKKNAVRQYVQGKSAAKENVEHINISQTAKQSGHNATVRKQEEEIAVGTVLVIVRRGEVTAGPHGTTVACLRLKRAVCKTGWPVLASLKTICKCQLGERAEPMGYVTAATSCCLEMALWRTLWMVDQVSLTAIDGLSASRNK